MALRAVVPASVDIAMRVLFAMVLSFSSTASGTSAIAGPTFSTGGACVTDAAFRAPAGARQVLLSNPAKVHLAATLYRQIDKPNFKYLDADGAERLSDFPYHYQVFIPPHGTGPVGCTKLFVAGGEAAQTFVLQKTDYFLEAPQDNTEDARLSAGFIRAGAGFNLINLHATKTIHVTVDRPNGPMTLDLSPQAVSATTIDGSFGDHAKSGRPVVKDVRF